MRFFRAARVLAAAASLAAAAPTFAADTWIGPGTDWNTAANWSPAAVPNSFSDDVIFGEFSAGPVNISSGVAVRSITFTSTFGVYDITSSPGQTLAITSITMAANVVGADRFDLATSTLDSLQAPLLSNLTFTNNSLMGGRIILGGSTVIGAFGGGGVIVQGPGDIHLFATFTSNPAIQVNGLTKNGPGTFDYAGDGSALAGATTLNGGTLSLDFGGSTSQKAAAGASLVLDNGILQVIGNGKNNVSQAYTGGTTINAGHTDITFNSSARQTTLDLSGITRFAGGTIEVEPSMNFTLATTAGNSNGLLGTGTAFATANDGTTWATASGGNIIALAEGSYSHNIVGSGVNADLTGGQLIGLTVNSIRFSTANDNFNLLSPGTLQSGGILVSPFATGAAITGSSLTASNGEFVFHVYSDDGFSVSSPLIASNGLTKTGPGNLTLAGNNSSLAGPININRGNLTLQNGNAVTAASQLNFNDNRAGNALQTFTVDIGFSATISQPIQISAFGDTTQDEYGTTFSSGSTAGTFTLLSGVLSSAPGQTTSLRFLNASPTNGFALTANNTFTGNILLSGGFLEIFSNASLGNAANVLTLSTTTDATAGLIVFSSGIDVTHPIVLATNSPISSPGTAVNTVSGQISGQTLYHNGTGTLILSNPNNSFAGAVVNAGTLSLGSSGGFSNFPEITVNAGATFSPGTTQTFPSVTSVTLQGGTFRADAGAFFFDTKQLTVGTGGTLDFTGSTQFNFRLFGATPTIIVNGDATWLSPNNASVIADNSFHDISVVIASGVTLTNGIALFTQTTNGYVLTGGGTLFQNSDATNQANFNAPITVSQGTYRVTDISTNGHGNLGTGAFTLDGGTLSYGGNSATTTHAIVLTASGGSIKVETLATTLTINAPIPGTGALTKTGPGTLALSSRTYALSAVTVSEGTLALAGATFTAANFTNNSIVTGPATFTGGSFANNGTFSNTSLLNSNIDFTNSGTFTQSGLQFWGANTFTNTAGTATFSTSPDATSAGHLAIVVSGGTVNLASLDNLGALTLTGGTTKLTGAATTGSLSPSISVDTNATLELGASYDFTAASAPTLTGTGLIIVDPGATLSLRVDSPFAGSIVVNGTLFLAAPLNPNVATFHFTVLDSLPVPEPASLGLLAPAILLRRRRRNPRPA
jgi:autotransporter-associated beta strand protein